MSEFSASAGTLGALPARFDGDLLLPGDESYDEVRRGWNGLFDRRPAVVARCLTGDDVASAVRFARERDLIIAVRGGGHSVLGHSSCDEGMLIDLSLMKGARIDTAARTIDAEAGLTWGEFDAATQAHGLAVTGGRFSTTGIAGLTLASGSGWLERKCGLTPDNLISAEVVTADGRQVTASADEHTELFWALRGGGGNFGIVTSFRFRLYDIGPIIYGGLLAAPPERARAILAFARDYFPAAPDDLGGAVAFVSAPPEPFVPPEMHFAPIVGVVVCWTGSLEEGERICAPLRDVVQPAVDMVQPMPYTALQSMLDAGAPKGTRAYTKAEFFEEMTDEVIDKLVTHGMRRAGPLDQLLIEPMGGQIRRVPEDATAISRRDVEWCYHALSLWTEPDEAASDAHFGWAREMAGDLKPHTTSGVYLNFTADAGEDRVRATYGAEKYARLVAVKDVYDPDNVFRLNQNIKPSGGR